MNLADRIRSRAPDIRFDALRGVAIGAVFAVGAAIDDGHSSSGVDPFDAPRAVIAAWLVVGGATAGAISGLLRPVATQWFGAAIVGII
ncbi:MAG TPA: hypothetical protein VGQ30_14150, partial [Gemmatimonadaceae bacterium]|nr:hypothetical protein [Gemmatimonadaceae bacterium]